VRSGLSRLKISEEAREAVLAHARPGSIGVYDHHDYFDEKRGRVKRETDSSYIRPRLRKSVQLALSEHDENRLVRFIMRVSRESWPSDAAFEYDAYLKFMPEK
jgi:hypothetical protein